MRTGNRILKITEISYPTISFLSNNGEYRMIDIKELCKTLDYQKGDFGYEILLDKDLFNQVELVDNALAWRNLSGSAFLPNGQNFEYFFHLDPLVTIENSSVDEERTRRVNYGRSIKTIRKYMLSMTQEELGRRIGSDKHYISKVENYQTDLELKTLRKIYEVGLEKELMIAYYDKSDPIKSFSNSVFNVKFLIWANANIDNLELIEGIGTSIMKLLHAYKIETTRDLSKLSFVMFLDLIRNQKLMASHNPDTWITQAKLIMNSDWLSVIKLQKLISNKGNKEYSKIEQLAKREIKEAIYIM